MDIKCDQCKKKHQGKYSSFLDGDKVVTLCDGCRYGTFVTSPKSDEERFNELQTPYWKILGLKPKPEEIAKEKYLKWSGKTYGDLVKEQSFKYGKFGSAYGEFNQHYKKYGRNDAPAPSFSKDSQES